MQLSAPRTASECCSHPSHRLGQPREAFRRTGFHVVACKGSSFAPTPPTICTRLSRCLHGAQTMALRGVQTMTLTRSLCSMPITPGRQSFCCAAYDPTAASQAAVDALRADPVLSKILDRPRVQAALKEVQRDPATLSRYVGDADVMKVQDIKFVSIQYTSTCERMAWHGTRACASYTSVWHGTVLGHWHGSMGAHAYRYM